MGDRGKVETGFTNTLALVPEEVSTFVTCTHHCLEGIEHGKMNREMLGFEWIFTTVLYFGVSQTNIP